MSKYVDGKGVISQNAEEKIIATFPSLTSLAVYCRLHSFKHRRLQETARFIWFHGSVSEATPAQDRLTN